MIVSLSIAFAILVVRLCSTCEAAGRVRVQTKATILFVCSSEEEHQSITSELRHAGFQVLDAMSLGQVLALTDTHPDVILLDSSLPDLDSIELCRQLRTTPATCGVPIIEISADTAGQRVPSCIALSAADDCISRQTTPQELVAKVTTWAKVRQSNAELYRRNAELEATIQELQTQLGARSSATEDQNPAFQSLEAERDFNTAILNTATVLIVVLDPQCLILRFNHTCEDVTGYSASEVCGRVFWNFVPPEDVAGLKETWNNLCAGRFPCTHENSWIAKDGSRHLIAWTNTCVLDSDGSVRYIVATGIDITERRRAEQALQKSENEARARAAELAALLDTVPAVIFVAHDPECRRITSSRTACELLRVPYGSNTSKSAPEGERPTTFRAMRHGYEIPVEDLPVQIAARTGREVRGCELSIVYEDGGARDLFGNAVPLFDEQGKPRGAVAAFIDITERRLVEEALRKNQELLRFHVENTPLAVIEWGPDFLLSRWSEGAERIFGWSAEEVLGRRLDQFRWVHEDDVAHVAAVSAGLLDGSCTRGISRNRNYRKDGSIVHCEWYNSSRVDESGNCLSILSLVLDVTERAQAEEALRRSEARYRTLFDSIDEGFCVIELIFDDEDRPVDYRFLETNPAFEKHSEFKNASGRTIKELVPDLEPRWFELFGRVATTGEPTRYSIGSQVLQRWYEGYAFRIGEPEQRRVAILFKDITEPIRAEAALRESEDRFRSVLENLSEGLMLFDRQQNLIYQNPASLRIHGFDPEDEGRISHEELPATWEAWDETERLITFEEWPVSRVFRRERFQDQVLHVRRVETGQEFYGSYNGSPLLDSAGNLIAGFITIRDITQQKRTQEALIRNEKLASVGRMAATVAHEINNPLAAVMNAIFIARSSINNPSAALEALDLADGELRRVAHLTRQTLGFYRESTAPAELYVREIADSALDLLANKIRTKAARVSTRYCENTHIVGIAGELRQVLSNLLANSLDAVEADGTISLRVSRTRACGREQLRITIADNGPGISSTIRAHIFEPFFTTKEAVGTGLGLWVSRQIVEKHGGSIRVHSSISGARRGTTFSVLLPAQAPEAACAGS